MHLTTQNRDFLQSLSPKKNLTYGDLRKCVDIWQQNHTIAESWRLGRWSSHGMPRSIYELNTFVNAAIIKADTDEIEFEALATLLHIENQREARGFNHSDSALIFRALQINQKLFYSTEQSKKAIRNKMPQDTSGEILANRQKLQDFIKFIKYAFEIFKGITTWRQTFIQDFEDMLNAMIYLLSTPSAYAKYLEVIKTNKNHIVIPSYCSKNDATSRNEKTQSYVKSILIDFINAILIAAQREKLDQVFFRFGYNGCIGAKMIGISQYVETLQQGQPIDEKMEAIVGELTSKLGNEVAGEVAVKFCEDRLTNQTFTIKNPNSGEQIQFTPDRNYICWYLATILGFSDIPDYQEPEILKKNITSAKP